MNHVSILIVDDDYNKITSIINTIREVIKDVLSISQASCVQEAVENLQKKEFHLLITDLQMPVKYDDTPDDNGGASLLRSIYRGRGQLNIPLYVIGLTQFIELKNNFHNVWRVIHYDSTSDEWKKTLRDLIFHISLVKSRVIAPKIETIFVEGSTDEKILYGSIKLYYPHLADRVYIDSIKFGGGASWVERQLFIWAKSLSKGTTGDYIKAVGIFDNDYAGLAAIEKVGQIIESHSAESQTFSIVKSSFKYSALLKSIKLKGITFPTTMEDLVGVYCWKVALKSGWLKSRAKSDIIIDVTILKLEVINSDNLRKNGFTEDEILLTTMKVNDEYKRSFAQLASQGENDCLLFISYMLKDIFNKNKLLIA